jgi:hypothetical protein
VTFRLGALLIAAAAGGVWPRPIAAFAQPPQPPPAPPAVAVTVDVIGTTPLPGVDVTLDKMPSPVQTAIARDLDEAGALDLSAFLNLRMNGVYVNVQATYGSNLRRNIEFEHGGFRSTASSGTSRATCSRTTAGRTPRLPMSVRFSAR